MGGGGTDNSTTCAEANPHYYGSKVDNPAAYNWCLVPHSGADVILFAGVAVVVACLWQSKFSTLLTMVTGFVLQLILYHINIMDYMSSAIAWWLGIEPYELFFYVFLPPLLLDAGLRIDIFLFKKVWSQVLVLAFGVVIFGTAMLVPIMLYVFNLRAYGWKWQHVALFGSMVASTDAVAIISVMKECGGPRRLRVMLEGEALLNDASAITLFTIFMDLVVELATSGADHSVGYVIQEVVVKTLKLAFGGLAVGLGFAIAMHIIMRWLARIGAPRDAQISLTVAAGYLCFYVANSPCKFSGVISVAVFALYGAANSRWDASVKLEQGGVFEVFWDTLAYIVNAVVFFYSGVAIANFVLRSYSNVDEYGKNLEYLYITGMMIPIWFTVFFIRFFCLVVFQPVYWVARTTLSLRESAFITFSGLRGSVSLIMAQAVVTEVKTNTDEQIVVKSEIVLFAAGLVLLTLLIQSPLLGKVLKALGLISNSQEKMEMRKRALHKLVSVTETAIENLKDDRDEFLRGVDWGSVQRAVQHKEQYREFLGTVQKKERWKSFWRTLTRRKNKKSPAEAPVTPGQRDDVAAAVEGRTHTQVHDTVHAFKARLQSMPTSRGSQLSILDDGALNIEMAREVVMEEGHDTTQDTLHSTAESSMGVIDRERWLRQATQRANATNGPSQGRLKTAPKDGSVSDDDDPVIGDVPFTLDEQTQDAVLNDDAQHLHQEAGTGEQTQHRRETAEQHTTGAQRTDLRVRLAASMKRYFHDKRMEGLLSSKSQRVLANACDLQIDDPSVPLDLWGAIEREVVGLVLVKTISKFLLLVRRAHLATRRSKSWSWIRKPVQGLLYFTGRVCLRWLGKRMTMACEVAIEYEMALLYNPMKKWLEDTRQCDVLLKEISMEVEKVSQFIFNREMEAPDRFNAIQTYRATLAVLRRQSDCVEHMFRVGMIDEGDRDAMVQPIETAETRLTRTGPTSKAPLLKEVLRSLPFLRHMPRDVIRMMLQQGELVGYAADELITDLASSEGMYVVLSGVVAILYEPADTEGNETQNMKEYFLSSGGVFGLYNALTGEVVPGGGKAVAKGRAVGNGPVVFVCGKAAFDRIHKSAALGDEVYTQLLLDMYRLSALYCVGRLHTVIMHNITLLLREMASGSSQTRVASASATAAKKRSSGEEAARARLAALFMVPTDEEVQVSHSSSSQKQAQEEEGVEEAGLNEASGSSPPIGSSTEEEELDDGPITKKNTPDTYTHQQYDRLLDPQLQAACNKQAREVYNRLKPLLTSSELLELLPGQQYCQCTSIVVMKGALCTQHPILRSIKGPGVSTDNEGRMELHAPFVLPWVWDTSAAGPHTIQFTAHQHDGATLLYCTATDVDAGEASSTTFTLGQDLPLGQDLRSLLQTKKLVPGHVASHPASGDGQVAARDSSNSHTLKHVEQTLTQQHNVSTSSPIGRPSMARKLSLSAADMVGSQC